MSLSVERAAALPTLPDPGRTSAAALVNACRAVYSRRDEIIGRLDVRAADELRRQSSAIEEYLRGTEAYPDAQRAARVLEMAVGAALGKAHVGRPIRPVGRILSDNEHQDETLRKEFRQLHTGRASIEPYLESDGLSREAALRIAQAGAMGGLKATTGNEWYTPVRYIEAAREVMGGIDLDPASSELANQTVTAGTWWGIDDTDPSGNGSLDRDWFGRVWLNPPYGKGSGLFTIQLTSEYDAGRVEQAVLLLNAYGFDSDWFEPLWLHPICFTDHRVEFTSPFRKSGGPANGNVFVYLGPHERRFAEVFSEFGHVVRTWP